jgi:hypothetical protein
VYLLCGGRDPLKSLTERPLPEDMRNPSHVPASEDDRCGLVRSLLAQSLERGTFVVPRLPEAAVRIVELREDANAQQLSAVIKADPALTMYILRIAASAPNRPALRTRYEPAFSQVGAARAPVWGRHLEPAAPSYPELMLPR